MKVIRKGCFETNSSSMHSIVVTKNDKHVTTEELIDREDSQEYVYLGKDGIIMLWDIDYGYGRSPFAILATFEDKLKYAMCEFLGYKYADDPEYDEIYDEFVAIVKELIPEFKDFYIHKRKEDIYLDENGNHILMKDLIYDGWDVENNRSIYKYKDDDGKEHEAVFDEENVMEMPNIGTIDHQSAGTLKNFLKTYNITLKEFLTNIKYIVVVDGDEYLAFENFKYSGLINIDNIVEEYR